MAYSHHDILNRIRAGEVVPIIGQLETGAKYQIGRLVKSGQIAKWRGHWFPTPGAPWGIGPLKTCYGSIEARDYFASFKRVRA